MKHIQTLVIQQAYSFEQYHQLMTELVQQGKTTGPIQSEDMAHYTKMNLHRMERILKRQDLDNKLIEAVNSLQIPLVFLTITEAWCGDAAQNIPVLQKALNHNPLLKSAYILRDQHLDIMDAFLTNGGRSIPKVLALKPDTFEVISTWGPRPETAQHEMERLKQVQPPLDKLDIIYKIQEWYNTDKTQSAQAEFASWFMTLGGTRP